MLKGQYEQKHCEWGRHSGWEGVHSAGLERPSWGRSNRAERGRWGLGSATPLGGPGGAPEKDPLQSGNPVRALAVS